ncbi:hypothetical protein TorRG33x02_251550 [Trema orientale]|uniref:Uncharacterized protein n=1 Tax=Trema orientale TaxID=63057 RepID=A0A2P5DGZ9_TREOI|nr:hypothetical protein TorRG33x02_251550 [Trema orientale]
MRKHLRPTENLDEIACVRTQKCSRLCHTQTQLYSSRGVGRCLFARTHGSCFENNPVPTDANQPHPVAPAGVDPRSYSIPKTSPDLHALLAIGDPRARAAAPASQEPCVNLDLLASLERYHGPS